MLGRSITAIAASKRPFAVRRLMSTSRGVSVDQYLGGVLAGGFVFASCATISGIHSTSSSSTLLRSTTTTESADAKPVSHECLMMGLADGYIIQQCFKK
mmetsp:Transcript_23209/g.38424  ORF Transcript_23209/g.38424 Transcript_23209/m.38424 type:complete len:99 (+) Transcript_23209:25-321(+)